MEQTFVQARVQCLEFSNGRIRVTRSGQDSELRWFLAAVTVVSIVALYYLQLDWLKLISRLPDLGNTFGLLALLDFHDFGLTLEAFSQTVAITVLATIYSVLLGLVLAAFGARNLMKNKFVTYALSAFFTFLRAVPTPVWVLLAMVCLGLGPAAGIVGLCVHATAFFARAFTQSFEDVPEEVIEALEATGASKLHIFLSAILPAAASQIMAWTGLRFEINFSESAILGMIGAGGIGFAIANNIQGYQFGAAGLAIVLVFGFAYCVELVFTTIKKNYI